MESKITVKVDGKKVDLEDALDVFEDLFDDVESAFDHMEERFSAFDSNISRKLTDLKIKLAAKQPHKYKFIPESVYEQEKMQETINNLRSSVQRNLNKRKMIEMRNVMLAILFSISLTIIASLILFTDNDKKETSTPTTIEKIVPTENTQSSSNTDGKL